MQEVLVAYRFGPLLTKFWGDYSIRNRQGEIDQPVSVGGQKSTKELS